MLLGGGSVLQTINGDSTFFVSPDDQFNKEIKGKFGVETTYDNDYIGFVFGYQTPAGTGSDLNFILFDWKQADQWGSREGFTLIRVNGTSGIPFSTSTPHHTENLANGYDVWATDYGSTRGWADKTVYDFTLLYQTNRIKIDIKGGSDDFATGETIFDIAPSDVGVGSFFNGKFGFYNLSQSDVRYQSFVESAAPPHGRRARTIHFRPPRYRQRLRGVHWCPTTEEQGCVTALSEVEARSSNGRTDGHCGRPFVSVRRTASCGVL